MAFWTHGSDTGLFLPYWESLLQLLAKTMERMPDDCSIMLINASSFDAMVGWQDATYNPTCST